LKTRESRTPKGRAPIANSGAPVIAVICALLLAALVFGLKPASAATCESLSGLALPHTKITSATSIKPPPDFESPASPFGTAVVSVPFCRVVGIIDPAIAFEVWMPPASKWNGRFQGTGNGGVAGVIDYSDMRVGLNRGYAIAGSDLGHAGGFLDSSFALGHPALVVDWGYRGTHEMTEKAKAIVRAFYGKAPHHSYFTGCSGGGRQGLMEAQRYPGDYDGIVAGDPTIDFTRLTVGGRLWVELVTLKPPASYIPQSKIPLIANAVNQACDKLDGIADGILNDPRRCHFNPALLLCRPGQNPDTCLTAPQVEAVKKIYAGPTNSKGEQIFPGYEPGGELGRGGWGSHISGRAPFQGSQWAYASSFVRYMVFERPNYDPLTFNYDTDVPSMDNKPIVGQTLATVINATDPNLKAFKARGGKIVHYHGWSDPGVAPMNSVNYYESVIRAIAGNDGTRPADSNQAAATRETQDFYRLFMAPGMQHCGGGPGPNAFGGVSLVQPPAPADPDHDVLMATERWVERGVAPDRIIATKYKNDDPAQGIAMTRPLCPFPRQARYKGAGSTTDAANFTCAEDSSPR
jgi:feruloyl esterase